MGIFEGFIVVTEKSWHSDEVERIMVRLNDISVVGQKNILLKNGKYLLLTADSIEDIREELR